VNLYRGYDRRSRNVAIRAVLPLLVTNCHRLSRSSGELITFRGYARPGRRNPASGCEVADVRARVRALNFARGDALPATAWSSGKRADPIVGSAARHLAMPAFVARLRETPQRSEPTPPASRG